MLDVCRLRELELSDATILFRHLMNPEVSQFSRLKPATIDQLMEEILHMQQTDHVISRIIENHAQFPVGMITLWDYDCYKKEGFLATWIAKTYWGKGYNRCAKELFLQELFDDKDLENVFLKVRNSNPRSLHAVRKIPYIKEVPSVQPNYYLFQIEKASFFHAKEAACINL